MFCFVKRREKRHVEPIIIMMSLYRELNNKVQPHTKDTDIVSGKERSRPMMNSRKKGNVDIALTNIKEYSPNICDYFAC